MFPYADSYGNAYILPELLGGAVEHAHLPSVL